MPMWWWEEIPGREMGVTRRPFPTSLTGLPVVTPATGPTRRPPRIMTRTPGNVGTAERIGHDEREYVSATTDPGQAMFKDFRDFNRAVGAGGRLVRGPVGGIVSLISAAINLVLGPVPDPTQTDDQASWAADPIGAESVDFAGAYDGMAPGGTPGEIDPSQVAMPGAVSDPVNESATDPYATNVQETIGPSVTESLGLTGSPGAGNITDSAQVAGPQSFPDAQAPEKVAMPDPVADPFSGGPF